MSSPWERIPKELLEAILEKIEEHEVFMTRIRKTCLFQVMLTCKHWSSIAKPVFYNELFVIDLDTAKKLISDKAIHPLALKNMEVTYELANDATFIKLLSLCPNLTCLRVQDQPYRTPLSNPRKSFYTSLYVLSRSNHLSKLRKVEFDLDRAFANQLLVHHQQAMLELKQSLTDLQIVDSTRKVEGGRHNLQLTKQFIEWFDLLKDFPHLTTVKIAASSLTYLYEMDRFIQKMDPKVTNISITLNYVKVPQPREPINLAATARRRAPLETLTIAMPFLHVEDIQYMLHKFDTVYNLHVDLWGVAYNEDPAAETLDLNSNKSADTFRQWIKYLTRVPTFLITKIRMFNRNIRQTLMDLKKHFQVKHLTITNTVDSSVTSIFSVKSLSKRASDGQRRQIYLDLEIGTAQLLSVAALVYELLNEDVVELQFGFGLIEHYDGEYDDRSPCPAQGEAVKLGINLLPCLKVIKATNPGIDSMRSIVNPKAPKLALDVLELGDHIKLEALLEMSQRIKSIEKWSAPCHSDFDEDTMERQSYVLNMPFTTFGEIDIYSDSASRFIVKLTTSSNTTFHGIGLSKDNQLPTEDDYYVEEEDDDEYPEEFDYQENLEVIGKVTIVCANVKKVKVGLGKIEVEN